MLSPNWSLSAFIALIIALSSVTPYFLYLTASSFIIFCASFADTPNLSWYSFLVSLLCKNFASSIAFCLASTWSFVCVAAYSSSAASIILSPNPDALSGMLVTPLPATKPAPRPAPPHFTTFEKSSDTKPAVTPATAPAPIRVPFTAFLAANFAALGAI